MNSLDELLSSVAQVPGLTPDQLDKARAGLDAAIAQAQAQPDSPALRKAAGRWWRGKTVIGVTAVAAVTAAAVAATVIVPSAAPRTRHVAAPSAKPTVKAKPAPRKPSPVTFKIGAETTAVSAAYVLNQAASAAGSAAGSEPAGGWPNARYWYVESQTTQALCDGTTVTSKQWFPRSGNGARENSAAGPYAMNQFCGVGPGAPSSAVQPTSFTTFGTYGDSYTWSQLYRLPTNPATLGPLLLKDSNIVYYNEPPADPHYWTGPEAFFSDITGLLTSSPASPALRKAFFEVLATQIPGVKVDGTYTDSLGRTGKVLRLGAQKAVVDPSTGKVLATMWAGQSLAKPYNPQGCVYLSPKINVHKVKCAFSGPSTTVYISAGPASGLPG